MYLLSILNKEKKTFKENKLIFQQILENNRENLYENTL